jgi:hypothetical protein
MTDCIHTYQYAHSQYVTYMHLYSTDTLHDIIQNMYVCVVTGIYRHIYLYIYIYINISTPKTVCTQMDQGPNKPIAPPLFKMCYHTLSLVGSQQQLFQI